MQPLRFRRRSRRRRRTRRRDSARRSTRSHRASRPCRLPWQLACTITAREMPSRACSASQRSRPARRAACSCDPARTGNRAAGPNTWQCASQAPGGSAIDGFTGSGSGGQAGLLRVCASFVFEAARRPLELLAHVVDVEPELARLEARARPRLLLLARLRGRGDLERPASPARRPRRRRRRRSRRRDAPARRRRSIGVLTEPTVALIVPLALTAFDHTGNSMSAQFGGIAAAGVDHEPDARRARGTRSRAARRTCRRNFRRTCRAPTRRPAAASPRRHAASSCRRDARTW